jgi:hypothetical protein
MWLITTFGYFSIVQKKSDRAAGLLTVRARVKKDLELLRDKYLPSMGKIEEQGGADYPYRVKVSRDSFAIAFLKAIMDVEYANFKAESAHQLGFKREDVYTQIWLSLRKLQTLDENPAIAQRVEPVGAMSD